MEGFILRRFEVRVHRYGSGIYLAPTRGKALAQAWRSDAFDGFSFGDFLKIARCRLTEHQVKPVPITVLGEPAFKVDHDSQYVQFVYPGGEFVLNAHPLDVLPPSARPRAYRHVGAESAACFPMADAASSGPKSAIGNVRGAVYEGAHESLQRESQGLTRSESQKS